MDLTPHDLGTERYLAIMRRRLSPAYANQANGQPGSLDSMDESDPHVRRAGGRRIRKYWVKDLGLDEDQAERLSFALWRSGLGMGVRVGSVIISIYTLFPALIAALTGGGFWIPFLLVLLWSMLVGLLMMSPRRVLRKIHNKKLTAAEVDNMLPIARGRLDRAYVNLVSDALRQHVPTGSAQDDIRAALRDLGEAISHLPGEPVPTADPALLRREAAERRQQAQTEADSFVKASLLRQAEAYEQRAALGDHNTVSARRMSALRHEARVQLDALRSVLIAFDRTAHADAAGIAALSQTVQRVAQEAQAVSVARRELEEGEIVSLLGHPLPANLPTQPVSGARQPVSIPAPAEQQVGRPWWRGQS